MRRIITILLTFTLVLSSSAQTRKTTTKKRTQTTTTKKKARTTTKSSKSTLYTNSSIKGLQSERSAIQKKIKAQEQALKANKSDVAQRLQNLMALNGEIDQRQKHIEGIQTDIGHIDNNISILNDQLNTLQQQLKERQARYVKSMRLMARHRNVQDRLMFIFSAKNFYQMYRRLRFVREYAQYQRAQGEMVKAKQAEVENKQQDRKSVV